MKKMLSPKEYVRELLNERKAEAFKENAILVKEEKEKEEKEKETSEFYEEMVQRQALPSKYNKFITSVKEEFLCECIYNVFNNALPAADRISKKHEFVKKALVKGFVEEQGVDKLLSKFRKQNALLSEFALIVDKAVKEVSESTSAVNINSWTVDTDIKDRFIDDLEKCNSKEAIITIANRVADAETDFVNDNMKKKIEIDEILKNKKERLDAIADKSEDLQESVALSYDRQVKLVKNRHVSSVYQIMAESTIKNVFLDEDLKKIYINNGDLDLDTLLEDVDVMYTFLECVFTTEMADKDYVAKFVNNI